MNITYTFPADCPIAALRGVTCTGGQVSRHNVGGKAVEVVAFETKVNGKSVMAAVEGKPELVAAVAAVKAAEAKAAADKQAALELAVPGLAAYEAASTAYSIAADAYDRASERGYPVREAANAKTADAALQAVFEKFPATKLWAQIKTYSYGSNYDRAGAADAAKKSVLAGVPIAEAVAKMEADWSAAASRAVWNS